jgi:hypothetical protein
LKEGFDIFSLNLTDGKQYREAVGVLLVFANISRVVSGTNWSGPIQIGCIRHKHRTSECPKLCLQTPKLLEDTTKPTSCLFLALTWTRVCVLFAYAFHRICSYSGAFFVAVCIVPGREWSSLYEVSKSSLACGTPSPSHLLIGACISYTAKVDQTTTWQLTQRELATNV